MGRRAAARPWSLAGLRSSVLALLALLPRRSYAKGATHSGRPNEFWINALRECLYRQKLREIAEKCREWGFSITEFNGPCQPDCRPDLVPADERETDFPINMSFPGLQTLNADYGVFQVDNFVDPVHLRAPFEGPHTRHPSSTPANEAFLAAQRRNASFCPWDTEPERHPTTTQEECDGMIQYLRSNNVHKYPMRTSFQLDVPQDAWYASHEVVQSHLDRLLPAFPRETREPFLLSHYKRGGYYSAHPDGRRCTVIIYADDGGEGGATYFPVLGLRVHRKAGRALIFFPNTAGGLGKTALIHAAEEVVAGEKALLQIFMDPGCVSPVLSPMCEAAAAAAQGKKTDATRGDLDL